MQTAIPSWDRKDGYLTVFMALILPLILSLYFALLQGARMNASRLEVTCAADAAADAAMTEFSAALFSRYDLFFIDTSYGSGFCSEAALSSRLTYYFEKNLMPSPVHSVLGAGSFTGLTGEAVLVTGTRYAADLSYLPLRQQIYAYMSADPAGALAAGLAEILDLWEGLPVDPAGWSGKMEEAGQSLEGLLEKSRRRQEEQLEEEEEGEEHPDREGNLLSEFASFRDQPVLAQVLGEETGVSGARTDLSVLFSGRGRISGTGLVTENSHDYPPASSLVLNAYLAEKCGSYTKAREGSLLQYQLEYILQGKDSDKANLEKTVETLLFMRWALNGFFLVKDPARQAELDAAAAALSLALLIPEFEPMVKAALLAAWAYLESIQDLKILLRGGRIPLVKNPETWKTDLESLAHMTTSDTEEGAAGLAYGEYLQILLYIEGSDLRCQRLMDIMEMDIRRTPGNEAFRMDGCLDSFAMEARACDGLGFVYAVTRNVTYN